jgi:hypothetical protein
MREGFSVVVANAQWPGRQGSGPAFVVITRHPLPRTSDDEGLYRDADNRILDKEFPGDQMRLRGYLGNGAARMGWLFVVRKMDKKEQLTLLAARSGPQGKQYDLAEGRLFLLDASADPPRTEQVKRKVPTVGADKESCVRVLQELAPRSEVAKSLLEEIQRR